MRSDSRSFEAQYPGPCAQGDWITKGETVRYVDDALQHVECPDDAEEIAALRAPVRPVCERCFTELPVSGVCGTCD